MADRRHAPFSRAAGGQPEGVNPLLFPPVLVKRALEDLGAIADVARRLPQIETALFTRVDGLITRVDGLIARIDAIAERIDSLGERLDGLAEEMAPIQNLAPVRAEIEAMHAAVAPLSRQMDELREEVRPIQQLSDVRAGIEPLDEDMHDVRKSIDELEPVVKSIRASIGGMDAKLDDMRGDLAPVGDLAEKVPGVGRR
jgi:uncharacterized coiled-coil DUF342 family protein